MISFSFSGIDGAGKSTQIASLQSLAANCGLSAVTLEFWDDIVVFAKFREHLSRKAFKGDDGIGSPEKPLNRRDKNVTSWPVTAMRFFFYLGDCLSLWWVARRLQPQGNLVIFDRYIYDELANLPQRNRLARWFVKCMLKLAPTPDAAFLIDAEPEAARARKPEYPLEFLHKNRASYLNIAKLAGMKVIGPTSIEDAEAKIRSMVLAKLTSMSTALTVISAPEGPNSAAKY